METGGEIWDLMHHALADQSRSPEDLTDEEAEPEVRRVAGVRRLGRQ